MHTRAPPRSFSPSLSLYICLCCCLSHDSSAQYRSVPNNAEKESEREREGRRERAGRGGAAQQNKGGRHNSSFPATPPSFLPVQIRCYFLFPPSFLLSLFLSLSRLRRASSPFPFIRPLNNFFLILVTVNSVPILHGLHFLSQAGLCYKYYPHRR